MPTHKPKDDLVLKKQFAPEPLLAFIARRGAEHPPRDGVRHLSQNGRGWLASVFGETANLNRQFDRWLAGATLSWWYADKVAGMLGVHPAWIWPDWYDEVEAEAAVAA